MVVCVLSQLKLSELYILRKGFGLRPQSFPQERRVPRALTYS